MSNARTRGFVSSLITICSQPSRACPTARRKRRWGTQFLRSCARLTSKRATVTQSLPILKLSRRCAKRQSCQPHTIRTRLQTISMAHGWAEYAAHLDFRCGYGQDQRLCCQDYGAREIKNDGRRLWDLSIYRLQSAAENAERKI